MGTITLISVTGIRKLFSLKFLSACSLLWILSACSQGLVGQRTASEDQSASSVSVAGPVSFPTTPTMPVAPPTEPNQPSPPDGGYIANPTPTSPPDVGSIAQPSLLTVIPANFNFQAQSLNSVSRATFTVTNVGGSYATAMVARGLTAPYAFSGGTYPGVGGTCQTTLAPAATCTMIVTFTPTAVGVFPLATFQLSYDSGVLSLPLDGGGTDIATLTISDEVDSNSSYNYGTLAYGTQVTHKFMVQYYGAVPATGVTFTGLSNPFTITSNQCGSEVSANCELQITYNGDVATQTQQKLKLVYNNGAFGAEADFVVLGTTTAQVTPATLTITDGTPSPNFGKVLVGTKSDHTFTVQKGGTLPATNVTPAAFSTSFFTYKGGSYPGIGGSCTTTITSNCSIVLTFSPTVLGLESDSIRLPFFDGQKNQVAQTAIQGTGAAPAVLTITPVGGQDFGNIAVNFPADLGFTISNGANSVNAVNIQVGGVTLPFSVVQNCTTTLSASQTCTPIIRFQPTQVGSVNGQITVTYFDGVQVQTTSLPLGGTGDGGAILQFGQSGYDFGSVMIGSTQLISVNVDYYGVLSGGNCAPAGIGSTPPSGGGFYFPGGYPGTGGTCLEQVNSPCKITIAFYPVTQISYSSTLTLSYTNGEGQTDTTTINLSGTGQMSHPAQLAFSPSAVNFSNQIANTTMTQTVYVQRTGDVSATNLSASGLSAPFQFAGGSYPGTGGTCGTTIANYADSCSLVLSFSPTVGGTYGPENLVLTYGNGVATQTVSLPVSGTAIDAALVKASSASFGNVNVGNTSPLTVTLTNSGTRAAEQLTLGASTLDAQYLMGANTCSAQLAPGASCTFALTFSPTKPGADNGVVPWTYNNAVASIALNVSVSGTGAVPLLVSANGNHTCARLIDGTVKCWGENNYGQLGLGDTVNRGDNTAAGHQMGSQLAPVALGTGRYAVALSVGYWHSCAVLDDGTVKCWGDNQYGQLGLGSSVATVGGQSGQMGDSLSAVNLGSSLKVVQVAAGYAHTCVLLQEGAIKCWGYNGEGQLGLGDTVNRGLSASDMGSNLASLDLGGWPASQISAGTDHTCAVLGNGSTKCWGNNIYGQLGQGDYTNRGDEPNEMGNNLVAIDLGTNHTAMQISAGGGFTCAILNDATVKCWGRNDDGILGTYWCQDEEGDVGSCSNSNFPTPVHGYGVESGQMGDSLPTVNLGSGRTVKSLSAANSSTCALLDDGTLKCWGNNDYGQLGIGNTTAIGTSPGQMGEALIPVNLGSGVGITSFSSGNFHNCAVVTNNNLKCWGDNHFGELGLGDTNNRGDAANEMGASLANVSLY
jgi:alpha-tubulin suppressor-like RCC1 family protein